MSENGTMTPEQRFCALERNVEKIREDLRELTIAMAVAKTKISTLVAIGAFAGGTASWILPKIFGG